MRRRVETTPVADAHIETVNRWWREHRQTAPLLFASELSTCIDLLAELPNLGRPYRHRDVKNVRRVLLSATRYHVYYVTEAKRVVILAVWHAKRGRGPGLVSV